MGVFTPQISANTTNQGTTVWTSIPESPPSNHWPGRQQLAQTGCLACSASSCFPGTHPLINMDAHLAGSRSTPPVHTHSLPGGSLVQTGEGRRKATCVLVNYKNKALGPAWPEYYMKPFLPSIPALSPLPNSHQSRRGACQASACHLLCSYKGFKGTPIQSPVPSFMSLPRPLHCAKVMLRECQPHRLQCAWCSTRATHILSLSPPPPHPHMS